jgi:hypothetical protein
MVLILSCHWHQRTHEIWNSRFVTRDGRCVLTSDSLMTSASDSGQRSGLIVVADRIRLVRLVLIDLPSELKTSGTWG